MFPFYSIVDIFQGDSGGSITCIIDDIYLTFGVVSWGIGCADPDRPGTLSSSEFMPIQIV